MRRDEVLFLDMLIALRKLLRFTQGMDFEQFKTDDLVQSAVMREFQVLGEAARLVSEESKTKHNYIPWAVITGMRHRLVHEYFRIRLDVVWNTIQNDVSPLVKDIEPLIPPDTL